MSIRAATIPIELTTAHVGGGNAITLNAPPARGNASAAGYSENAIARWNVVPYQTFSGTLKVGVVAYHIEGIEKVVIYLDGWPLSFTSMTLNSDTGTVEYFTTLDASKMVDGAHTLQAIAYPNSGVPRVLPNLPINSNGGGSLTRIARYASTTGVDGNDGLTAATPKTPAGALAAGKAALAGNPGLLDIKLLAGTYTFAESVFANRYASAMTNWTRFTPAEGVAKSAVIVNGCTGADGIVQQLVRWDGVTIHAIVPGAPSSYVGSHVWYSNCAFVGTATWREDTNFRDLQAGAVYVTDSSYLHCKAGPDGVTLARHITTSELAETGVHDCLLAIDAEGFDISPSEVGSSLHPDFLQWTGTTANNVIAIDLRGSLALTPLRIQQSGRDVAIINCDLQATGGYPYAWEMERPYRHILIKNTKLRGALPYEGSVETVNVLFDNCDMDNPPATRAGVTIR